MGRYYRGAGHVQSDKATNLPVTPSFLVARVERAAEKGFDKAKWVIFCETMMQHGLRLSLYEARKTFSKYVTVHNPANGKYFKVRFSNHRPIKAREEAGDCDFFVGVTNLTTTTTTQAIAATLEAMGLGGSTGEAP